MDTRKANFKKTLSKGDGSKKRLEFTSKIQKEKRDKSIISKRSKQDEDSDVQTPFSPDDVLLALQQLASKDGNGLRMLRKILCTVEPPIHDILKSLTQPVANIIEFLRFGDELQQLDAAWCITNLATGTHEETGAVLPTAPYLIQHISGSNAVLVEQCAWALGNISADCLEYRDVLRANGILNPLVSVLQRYANSTSPQRQSTQALSLARTAAFALSNQARGQNAKLEDFLDLNIVPILARVFDKTDSNEEMSDGAGTEISLNTEVLIESAWILTYLTTQSSRVYTLIKNAGLIPVLVRHLSSSASGLVVPILRTVGNIIARSDSMTAHFLEASMSPPLIPILKGLLSSSHRAIKKEATYVISNIAGGTIEHANQVVQHGLLPVLSDLLRNSQFDIARESAYALSNIGTNSKHVEALVDAGVIPGFLALFSSPDSEVLHIALYFIEMVLTFHPQGPAIVQKEDGIEKLEYLQNHSNTELYHLANELIDRFYGGGDGNDFEDSVDDREQIEYPPWRVRQ